MSNANIALTYSYSTFSSQQEINMVSVKSKLLQYLFLLMVAMIWVNNVGGTTSDAPTPAAASMDCSSALLSLADCLTFVEEGSKESKPQGQCCPGLKVVVKEEVACLCQAFKGSADYGVKLNMTKALTLPSACGLKTPPFSKCNIAVAGGAPVAAPISLSPVESPISSPSSPLTTAHAPASSPVQSFAATIPAPALLALLSTAAAICFSHL